MKKLHKRIMLSQAYQMSTAWNEQAAGIDPENRLLWRMPRRRMEAEELRDSLLAVSGQLDTTMGGTLHRDRRRFRISPSPESARKPELYQSTRRSVYLPVLRSAVYDLFQAFDFPDPAVPNGDRATTTVASSGLVHDERPDRGQASATVWPRSLLSDAGSHATATVCGQACRRILGRPAEPEECSEWTSFLERLSSRGVAGRREPRNDADASPGRGSAGPCCLPTSLFTSIDELRVIGGPTR